MGCLGVHRFKAISLEHGRRWNLIVDPIDTHMTAVVGIAVSCLSTAAGHDISAGLHSYVASVCTFTEDPHTAVLTAALTVLNSIVVKLVNNLLTAEVSLGT